MKTYRFANGHTESTSVRLPFIVRKNGKVRSFGSLAAARAAADGDCQIFFDYEPGCGTVIRPGETVERIS